MKNQEQECVQIELDFPPKKTPSPQQIRNRRYKKLQELRDNGFFSEEAIKLRHPLLYHTYLGQHSQRNNVLEGGSCTLSQFLQKNLINLQYRQRLEEELDSKIEEEPDVVKQKSEDNWQVLEQMVGQITLGKEGIKTQTPVKSWEVVQEEEIQLEEDNLIDHAQQLFLDGRVDKAYINYNQIDNCSDYDSINEENRVDEEQYFCGQNDKEEDEKINREHYTGIQDY